jgi:hypothetical protein
MHLGLDAAQVPEAGVYLTKGHVDSYGESAWNHGNYCTEICSDSDGVT